MTLFQATVPIQRKYASKTFTQKNYTLHGKHTNKLIRSND